MKTCPVVVKTRDQMARFVEQIEHQTSQEQRPDYRRGLWRLLYIAPGTVELEEPLSSGEAIYMTSRDISVEGMGFVSHSSFKKGQRIVITLDTPEGQLEIRGSVMHSKPTISMGTYVTGVKFEYEDTHPDR